jgi:hypothetical protein
MMASPIKLLCTSLSLITRGFKSAGKLVAVKWFAGAIPFDDRQPQVLDFFKRGEAPFAAMAKTAPLDCHTIPDWS